MSPVQVLSSDVGGEEVRPGDSPWAVEEDSPGTSGGEDRDRSSVRRLDNDACRRDICRHGTCRRDGDRRSNGRRGIARRDTYRGTVPRGTHRSNRIQEPDIRSSFFCTCSESRCASFSQPSFLFLHSSVLPVSSWAPPPR